MSHVLLAITGSIAAYKTPDLVRLYKKAGHDVTCLLSDTAKQFVTRLSLEVASENKVCQTEDFFKAEAPHLALAKTADILVIAPTTAHHMAKFNHGQADTLISASFLSFTKPILIVPAMHTEMWENPITQQNRKILIDHHPKCHFFGPVEGALASGDHGIGRMAELHHIVEKTEALLKPMLPLKNKHILITCGGTKEAIDNVRVLTNKSTGKLGLALAKLATYYGAKVNVISTLPLDNPGFHSLTQVDSVEDLQKALHKHIKQTDTLYMVAAVSDFTIKQTPTKLERKNTLTLNLTSTPDLLKELSPHKKNKTFIGFCLADTHLESIAKQKLQAKNLDHIIANKSTMIGKTNREFWIISKDNTTQHFKNLSLENTAYELLKLA